MVPRYLVDELRKEQHVEPAVVSPRRALSRARTRGCTTTRGCARSSIPSSTPRSRTRLTDSSSTPVCSGAISNRVASSPSCAAARPNGWATRSPRRRRQLNANLVDLHTDAPNGAPPPPGYAKLPSTPSHDGGVECGLAVACSSSSKITSGSSWAEAITFDSDDEATGSLFSTPWTASDSWAVCGACPMPLAASRRRRCLRGETSARAREGRAGSLRQ